VMSGFTRSPPSSKRSSLSTTRYPNCRSMTSIRPSSCSGSSFVHRSSLRR
jgi:hypothetical protein